MHDNKDRELTSAKNKLKLSLKRKQKSNTGKHSSKYAGKDKSKYIVFNLRTMKYISRVVLLLREPRWHPCKYHQELKPTMKEKYHVSVSYLPSSIFVIFLTFVNSSCSRKLAACRSSSCPCYQNNWGQMSKKYFLNWMHREVMLQLTFR